MAKKTAPKLSSVSERDIAERLQTLSEVLAVAIDATPGHGLAGLSKVYLETLKELREINGDMTKGGVADAIIASTADPNRRRLSVI